MYSTISSLANDLSSDIDAQIVGLTCPHIRFGKDIIETYFRNYDAQQTTMTMSIELILKSRDVLNNPVVRLCDGKNNSTFVVKVDEDASFVKITKDDFVVCYKYECERSNSNRRKLGNLLQERDDNICPHIEVFRQ